MASLDRLAQHIESLIFVSEHAITLKQIKFCLDEVFQTNFSVSDIEGSVGQLVERYQNDIFSVEIVETSGGYRFMTKGRYHTTISSYLKQTNTKKLSKAAMETLSIIAYKQPITKSSVEQVRGVSCDYSIKKLLEKGLVEIVGRSEGPGKPLLYATSGKFMDYFNLNSVKDLPKLKEMESVENTIGEGEPTTEEE